VSKARRIAAMTRMPGSLSPSVALDYDRTLVLAIELSNARFIQHAVWLYLRFTLSVVTGTRFTCRPRNHSPVRSSQCQRASDHLDGYRAAENMLYLPDVTMPPDGLGSAAARPPRATPPASPARRAA
jgi:hypothetical protein